MRLFRLPFFAGLLYPRALRRLKTDKRELVLTFDDSPDPESTPQVLRVLDDHHVRAVFFCTGRNAEKYPELMSLIRSKGHFTGNHGYDHINGLKNPLKDYMENVSRAAGFTSQEIFRPPYGRMKLSQYRELAKSYRIVLWDLMPYDFDRQMGKDKCLNVLKKKLRPGSVIVLHDTHASLLLSFLDELLSYAEKNGYSFVNNI
jgi:peptidoglycan-N-acetylglucosamine deacetylase